MKGLSRKAVLILGLFLTAILLVSGCGGAKVETKKAEVAPKVEEKKATKGTLYLPGMGGHIAVVDVEIDPEADEPIKVKSTDRIKLGTPEVFATHDVRIDHDRGVAYSSGYVKDPKTSGVHVAKIDLETLQVEKDVSIAPSDRYVGGPMYCASGQGKDTFLPVMMGYEGWIDVIDKESLDLKHRVHFDDPSITKNYIFAHGVQTPDMSQLLLVLNETSAEQAGKKPPRGNPNFLFYLLDMASLEQGKLKIDKSSTIEADPNSAIAFRQSYTSDGKYLLQSGRDRVLIIDGETLELINKVDIPKELETQIECHDVIPTADGKFAVLALRAPVAVDGAEKPVVDGMVQLMDIEKGKLIGEPVSVCRTCHDETKSLKTKDSTLCGIDAVWAK